MRQSFVSKKHCIISVNETTDRDAAIQSQEIVSPLRYLYDEEAHHLARLCVSGGH